jgi:protein O-GlcNAc transferase
MPHDGVVYIRVMRWAIVLFLALALQIPVDSPTRSQAESIAHELRREAILTMNGGVEAFARLNFSDAERKLRDALRLDPGLVHARVNLGRLALERDQLIDAEKAFRVALREIDPQPSTLEPGSDEAKQLEALRDETYHDLGRVLLAEAKLQGMTEGERRTTLEQAVAALSKTPESDYLARYHLGLAYDQLDRASEADHAFRACIEAQPLHGPCYVSLSSLYYDFGFPQLAEAVLEAGAQVNETDAQIWLAHARLLGRLDRHNDAVSKADKALSIDPNLVQAYYVLGMAHADRRDRKQAVEALEKFLSMAGSDVPEDLERHARATLAQLQ